jgi:hypothetical protein
MASEKASDRLEGLTRTLVMLTVVVAALTIVLVVLAVTGTRRLLQSSLVRRPCRRALFRPLPPSRPQRMLSARGAASDRTRMTDR